MSQWGTDMTAKITASADGTKVTIGTAAEDALQTDSAAKTIKALAPYVMTGNGPAFRASGAAVSPAVNVAVKVPVQTEVFDTNSNYDAPNSRFTPTVPGYYQLNCAGGNQSANDATGLYIMLMKNSITILAQGGSTGNVNAFAKGSASVVEYFNGTTDFVEVWITPLGVSGTLNVNCDSFSGVLVRAA